jgi:hypothetical protein
VCQRIRRSQIHLQRLMRRFNMFSTIGFSASPSHPDRARSLGLAHKPPLRHLWPGLGAGIVPPEASPAGAELG